MALFWIIIIYLFLIIIFLLLLLSMFWPPDSPWAPWWRTNRKIALAACRLAGITSRDIVYELGSGDATLLLVAAKKFKAKGIGIEIDPLRAFVSTLMMRINKIQKKVKIIRKNFYDVDISNASVIFVYLVPRVLKKLKLKFLQELKPGTIIVSYKYKIELPLRSCDKENSLYLYKIN